MDTLHDSSVIAVALQLYAKGYAVMTKPGISLEADARARIASQVEGTFNRKELPKETPARTLEPSPLDLWGDEADDLSPVFSYTEVCPACGETHPC